MLANQTGHRWHQALREQARSYTLALALGVALLQGMATATAQDYRNCAQDWHIDHSPQRILALNQHAADLLLALGAGSRLIGVAYIDDDLNLSGGPARRGPPPGRGAVPGRGGGR